MASLFKSRFMRYGVPFVTLLVAGSFGLREFAQLRYTFRKNKLLSPEEAKKIGIDMKSAKDKLTPEQELEKMKNDPELDTWQNIRGPRPWEDSKEVQDAQRKNLAQN